MSPRYCATHTHWTDGPCQAGVRSLTREDVRRRVTDIEERLGDAETAQATGFYVNKALEAEAAGLRVLLAAGLP